MHQESTGKTADELRDLIEGEVYDSGEQIDEYSRDWSLFKVVPEIVVFPKSHEDVRKTVSYIAEHKAAQPYLSITGRSAGTDMTGGPLNESIILGCTKHLNNFSVDEENLRATVEPGVFYRDFEEDTLPEHLSMPSYPASKNIAALGGIVMNNSGGERTLRYGQTRDYVEAVKMVLSDGNEYEFRALSHDELQEKKAQDTFEGEIYRKLEPVIKDNDEIIRAAEPQVSKNSAGYALWRVWDREADTFDLAQLFCGSQGTLGILTEATLRLVHNKTHRRMVPVFFKSWEKMPEVVNKLLQYEPETLEAFDDETMKLGMRFMPKIAKMVGQNIVQFLWRFLPEAWIGVKMLGMPKLVMLVEIAEDSDEEAERKAQEIEKALEGFNVWARRPLTEEEAEKYWLMRRNSFKILTEQTHDKRTVPLVEDFCVKPEVMPVFLPKALKILADAGIKANLAGHAGNGNFHIIPLMDLTKKKNRDKLTGVADRFYDLVIEHGGTITAEHNDGILRTPYLKKMYGEKVYDLFEEIKNIFDPHNIFNPGKKVSGDRNAKEYFEQHIAAENK
ncbi:MAG: FAD-binding oxidoreductase [Candidatus Paceibacterota bacterium]